MGNFYVNYTILGTDREKFAQAFQGRNAVLTPERNGCIVAADEISDDQDQEAISEIAQIISKLFKTAVLAALNHDDDILWFQLYENGKLADEYDSCPNYFSGVDEDEEANANEDDDGLKGGNAKRLCAAFGADNPDEVEEILRSTEYAFAIERHQALVEALGISDYAVGFGYGYATSGELPPDLNEKDLLKITA